RCASALLPSRANPTSKSRPWSVGDRDSFRDLNRAWSRCYFRVERLRARYRGLFRSNLETMARFIPLLLIAAAITFGLHFYLWARLVRDTELAQPWYAIATGSLIALGVSMPLSFAVGRALGPRAARFFLWPVYVW